MEAFSKCPRCGDIDVRRMRCACGYGPDSAEPAPAAPAPHADDGEPPSSAEPRPAEGGTGLKVRLGGLLLLLIGAFLAYISVYEPLQAAARGDEKVSLSLKGAIVCPMALILGATLLVLGRRAQAVFGTRERPKPAVWVFVVLVLLVGLGLYLYLKSALEAQGYQF
jgi:hypothetical protein